MSSLLPEIWDNPNVVTIRNSIDLDIRGPTSFLAREFIIPAFSPKISILESQAANDLISHYSKDKTSVLDFLKYFEEPLRRQGHTVRFIGDVLKQKSISSYELWENKSIESHMDEYINKVNQEIKKGGDKIVLENSIYLHYLANILSSDSISPFECFNHPILRLIIVTGNESISSVNNMISSWNSENIPRWFDFDSVKTVVLILVNENDSTMLENALNLQETLREKALIMSSTVDKGRDIHLKSSIFGNWGDSIYLSEEVYNSWNSQLIEIITKELIPFMNNKIRTWIDTVVNPKKSLANRLFNTKKWGQSNKSSFFSFGRNTETEIEEPSYNVKEGYYICNSPEMTIKKLADWYFMLGDYKNSFNMYDLIKKDMTTEKAYLYVSVLQECIVVSLLLGACKKVNPFDNLTDDKSGTQSITPKMISEVINPSISSAFYSYLSKYNLKSYTIKMNVLVAEYYFLLGQSMAYSNSQLPGLTSVSIYYAESMNLFKRLIDSKLLGNSMNSLLMQRVAFIYYSFDKPSIQPETFIEEKYYEEENPDKLESPPMASLGRQRKRKSILWMLLAAKDLNPDLHLDQMKLIIEKIEKEMEANPGEFKWLERENSLLSQLKARLAV